MSERQDSRVKSIFLRVCDLSPERQATVLKHLCGSDPELRDEVAQLLAEVDRDGCLERIDLTDLARSLADPPHDVPPLSLPHEVGGFRIVRQLGEGGMGTVYLAEQSTPVRRQVALKVIKLGMDTREVIARFEAERQALALMNHPHVAAVYDAGTTRDGRPFFVMEFVPGEPITDFCRRKRLSIPARLELFCGVCQAVAHAHQKGVIHRDLKPSNVLIATREGKPVPKVIDFGVAKAMHAPLTEQTLVTRIGGAVGTPDYMSPEQAAAGGADVDTRTDVYALGMLLYELLADGLPAAAGTNGTPEAEQPRRLQRLSRVDRRLRGDLETIVHKALAYEKEKRYASVAALEEDLRRFLDNRPILARPPSPLYLARRYCARHRFAAASGLITLLLLPALLVALGAFLQSRSLADKRFLQARDTLLRQLDHADAFGNLVGGASRRAALLDEAYAGLLTLVDDNEDDPRLRTELREVYARLGALALERARFEEARAFLQAALAIRHEVAESTGDPNEWADWSLDLVRFGNATQLLGEKEQALDCYHEALAVHEQLVAAHPEVIRFQIILSYSFERLGDLARQAGRLDEAEDYQLRRLELAKLLAETAPDRPDVLQNLLKAHSVRAHSLGLARRSLAGQAPWPDATEEEVWQRARALEVLDRLEEVAPMLPLVWNMRIAEWLRQLGDARRTGNLSPEDTLALSRDAVQKARALVRADPEIAVSHRRLSAILREYHRAALGVGDERTARAALVQAGEAVTTYRRQHGHDPDQLPQLLAAHRYLAVNWQRQGEATLAAEWSRHAHSLCCDAAAAPEIPATASDFVKWAEWCLEEPPDAEVRCCAARELAERAVQLSADPREDLLALVATARDQCDE